MEKAIAFNFATLPPTWGFLWFMFPICEINSKSHCTTEGKGKKD